MKTKKALPLTILIVIALFAVSGILIISRFQKQLNEIFKMNATLKKEGYYLSEFECQLLGIAYYLDHGNYKKAGTELNNIHSQLTDREGLVKVDEFSDDREKLDIYLHMQRSSTGAFMNESYPLFTYFGPTSNMILYIEDLYNNTGEPFRLLYPLKFLDEINTPEKLVVLLDDLSKSGWIGSRFKTPFVEIGELWTLAMDAERLGLYTFTSEWKKAYFQWCYDHQDEETGLWGSRNRRTGKMLNGGNLTDSEKIISKFIDSDGNEIHPEFPLKHGDKIFRTALDKLSEPMPEKLDKLHEWILDNDRGNRFLLRYLWKNASSGEKVAAKKKFEEFIKIRFENYYNETEGAFSLYPHSEHSDLDGTGEAVGMYKYLGALSYEKRNLIWGDPDKIITDLGSHAISELKESDLAMIAGKPGVNSIRLYNTQPADDFIENTTGVYYPGETKVPDLADLLPKIENWVRETPQNMGNWVTKENLFNTLASVKFNTIPVFNGLSLKGANEILDNNSELFLVGIDLLQVPRYKIHFRKEPILN